MLQLIKEMEQISQLMEQIKQQILYYNVELIHLGVTLHLLLGETQADENPSIGYVLHGT